MLFLTPEGSVGKMLKKLLVLMTDFYPGEREDIFRCTNSRLAFAST
jgi:hypothetical protein